MTKKDFEIVAKIVALYEHDLPHGEEWLSDTANVVDYILEHAYPRYDHTKFFTKVCGFLEELEPVPEDTWYPVD